MKNLLNSPDINCETCELFNSTCKDKMILNRYIWCICGLTNKPGQPADCKEVLSWKTEIIKAETALKRQPIRETVVPNFTCLSNWNLKPTGFVSITLLMEGTLRIT